MSTIVIMPGGFHPFHTGHAALYQSAVKAFPGAEVFVAATNDTSNRPFPFAIKEKLAKLAGVAPGHFVQVKSPFRAEEITSKFNPDKDRLIFVRSEKDADKQPLAGGVKKDGNPAYLQPLAGQQNIRPFKEHAYMAYLPTVEFGPGMTSATEIRTAWPGLDNKRKTALVMSLYPQTQQNPKLAANVVAMLDTAIGGELEESNMLGSVMFRSKPPKFKKIQPAVSRTKDFMKKDFSMTESNIIDPKMIDVFYRPDPQSRGRRVVANNIPYAVLDRLLEKLSNKFAVPVDSFEWTATEVDENQGWAATFTNETNAQNFVGGMTASYQAQENQPIDEDYIDEKWSQKYKSSINCASPKGFSQRAHCAGRKK
jgi:hypothetical protein